MSALSKNYNKFLYFMHQGAKFIYLVDATFRQARKHPTVSNVCVKQNLQQISIYSWRNKIYLSECVDATFRRARKHPTVSNVCVKQKLQQISIFYSWKYKIYLSECVEATFRHAWKHLMVSNVC